MKRIPLTQGKFAIVDDDDYDWLMQWRWCAHKKRNGYVAVRNRSKKEDGPRTIMMHCEIMDAPNGIEVDHMGHDGLDNRRHKLRLCTHGQNMRNRKKHKDASSKFKGVSWYKRDGKWRACIQCNGSHRHLGLFSDEKLAARTYDKAAMKLFREFAYLNFPKVAVI